VYDASCLYHEYGLRGRPLLSSWSWKWSELLCTIPYTTLPGQDAPAGPPKRVVPSPGNGSGSEVGSSAIRFQTLFAGG
jgi:hypothetical protein